ncbi:hypothetical protein CWI38_2013p0010 [Hamiltosporidium tvaerminnensis]|uniref:Uncharacterized protein n=1 Tax=Hamiltosporidium tvaerminnensis TaxID=1176355 RepID=A0A4Q9LR61_9MICR|nr:hypothetical protein CWI38_2013p0010 [Hamiltosporidium tvaerminnensis]
MIKLGTIMAVRVSHYRYYDGKEVFTTNIVCSIENLENVNQLHNKFLYYKTTIEKRLPHKYKTYNFSYFQKFDLDDPKICRQHCIEKNLSGRQES